ncbi:hypothetical protein PoB_007633800 [Plakobranchus ocellatus]|uniref:Uncharacterized protein n=1 Tax=Plakobranchus ocellatus TaxID=259542 RepID=A0AAV4DZX1_9GAST|nr:hypothetical protein PoB_007633800 [Plakobranchus ocellatus]
MDAEGENSIQIILCTCLLHTTVPNALLLNPVVFSPLCPIHLIFRGPLEDQLMSRQHLESHLMSRLIGQHQLVFNLDSSHMCWRHVFHSSLLCHGDLI